ncbi:elongator complex protein 5 [Mustelus asterias]
MLQGLSGGAEPAGLLLIADSFECEGRSLLKSFLTSAALREEPVHVFNFELSESEFSTGLDDGVKARLHFHDGYSDPLNWEQRGTFSIDGLTAPELLRRVSAVPTAPRQPCIVVLDSLSWILLRRPIGQVCRVLQDFQRGAAGAGLQIRKVMGLLHRDLHQPEELEALSHIASTVVTLTASPECSGLRTEFLPYAVATTTLKRKSGRVLKKEEYFTIEERFTLRMSAEPLPGPESAGVGDTGSVDPAANLTFNLRLTEEERRARQGVTLPFHFSTEKKLSLLEGSGGEGRIYYQPDPADDVDDEDPDDDLDI